MPLVVNGSVVDHIPPETRSFLDKYPHYKDMATGILNQVPKVVGPHGLLYIYQREYAVCYPQDKNVSVLGTQDMTTCICAVLRHAGSGAVALGHFDGQGADAGVNNMVRRVQELSGNHHDAPYGNGYGDQKHRLELYLVGGFMDRHIFSDALGVQLLYAFHKQHLPIHLIQCCIVELNTASRNNQNYPIITGVGVNVKSGELFSATFHDRGPEIPLRLARQLTGSQDSKCQMYDIYDTNVGMLRVGPFNYEPMRAVDLWLQQNDDFLLQNLSTSPEVEGPQFVHNIRETLKYIQQHPFPGVTVFPDNRPHYFRKNENGIWVPVCY